MTTFVGYTASMKLAGSFLPREGFLACNGLPYGVGVGRLLLHGVDGGVALGMSTKQVRVLVRAVLTGERVHEFFGSALADPTTCACRVHVPVLVGQSEGSGCVREPASDVPCLRVCGVNTLDYDLKRDDCLVNEGTRVLDQAFVEHVRTHAFVGGRVLSRPTASKARKWFSSQLGPDVNFGGGYCAVKPLLPAARMRACRVMGPANYVLVAMAVASVAGEKRGRRVLVERVSDGYYHAVFSDTETDDVARDFIVDCCRAIAEGGLWCRLAGDQEYVRGLCEEGDGLLVPTPRFDYTDEFVDTVCSNERIVALRRVLGELGLKPSDRRLVDVGVVCFQRAYMPAEYVNGKARLALLARIGDAFLKTYMASAVYASNGVMVDFIELNKWADNHSLARVASAGSVHNLFDFEGLTATSKVRADTMEALVGAVVVHFGERAGRALLEYIGCPVVVAAESVEVAAGVPALESDEDYKELFAEFMRYRAERKNRVV